MYEVKGYHWFAEEDIFGEGCNPDTASYYTDNEFSIRDTNLKAIIDRLARLAGSHNYELDAAGEPGRIDFDVMEDELNTPASISQINEWKAGKRTLWAAIWTFRIEWVEREPVSLRLRLKGEL